jgi:hypothetical protein
MWDQFKYPTKFYGPKWFITVTWYGFFALIPGSTKKIRRAGITEELFPHNRQKD